MVSCDVIGVIVTPSAFPLLLFALAAWSCADPPEVSDAGGADPADRSRQAREVVSLDGSFAFANRAGTELLSLAAVADPGDVVGAICGDARRLPLRYVRTQSGRAETTNRHVADNFDNEAGDIFQLAGGSAAPNETCFLTRDSLVFHGVTAAKLLDDVDCDRTQLSALARLGDIAVLRCWQLAEIDGGARFLAAQFVNVDSSVLAAVSLVQDSVLLYYPLPGRYGGPGESTWRVDDGGVFDPTAITLLFVARRSQGHAAAFLWTGAEGEADRLVVADSTIHARDAIAAYRYWAPR